VADSVGKLRWGLIGASNIARSYMKPAIDNQPLSTVVAVASADPTRADAFARENGVPKAHRTVSELIDDPDIDVVYISTTNELHCPQANAAARAGKHVLCEKPLALSLDDAREMKATCERAGVVLGTNHHLRNSVTHRTIRQLIGSGTIGKPLAARVFHAVSLPDHLRGWRINDPGAGGGVILDITVHDADTLRFDLDDDPVEVVAMTASQGMASHDLPDAVMGVVRFKSGLLAQFHDAFTIQHTPTGIEFHGSNGTIRAVGVMTQQPAGQVFLQRGSKVEEILPGPHENLYERSVRLFNDAVLGAGLPAATGQDGIWSLSVALAAAESARTGQKVAVSV
jgi:1,5-anhydro-D-fructose reductase (1,5-anhydro-D-mannitol-forming)